MLESVEKLPEEERAGLLRAYIQYGLSRSLENIDQAYIPMLLVVKPNIDGASKKDPKAQTRSEKDERDLEACLKACFFVYKDRRFSYEKASGEIIDHFYRLQGVGRKKTELMRQYSCWEDARKLLLEEGHIHNYFKFFGSMLESIESLPERERAGLLRAYIKYGLSGSLEGIDDAYLPAVMIVKPSIDSAYERISEKIEKRKEKVALKEGLAVMKMRMGDSRTYKKMMFTDDCRSYTEYIEYRLDHMSKSELEKLYDDTCCCGSPRTKDAAELTLMWRHSGIDKV